jgi:hypothetical protein
MISNVPRLACHVVIELENVRDLFRGLFELRLHVDVNVEPCGYNISRAFTRFRNKAKKYSK